MIRILLLALLFIGIYRFVTRILFPMLRITSAVRRQMRNMNQPAQQQASTSGSASPRPKSGKGEYIDFEEVK